MLTAVTKTARAADLRPEQPEQHGRRDRPGHLPRDRAFRGRGAPQHVVPAWNLRTLYVTNDAGQQPDADRPAHRQAGRRRSRSTTPTTCTSRPTAGTRSSSPSGCAASISATRTPSRSSTRCRCRASGVDHMDFSADGSYLIASCEFSGATDQGRPCLRARRRHAHAARRAGRDAAGRQALRRRRALLRRRHAWRAASGRSTARRCT